ncbi:MAG: trimethylamine methyltransferase family protein [Alphaproteobacteria bacterium]
MADLRGEGRRRGRGRRQVPASQASGRAVDYRNLQNPFAPARIYSDDQIEQIHDTSLRVLEELGVKILLPAARRLLKDGGVDVDEASMMARFDRNLVQQAIASAPTSFEVHGAVERTSFVWGGHRVTWSPVGGPPHISDLDGGKRPGTLVDTENIIRLAEHYDVMHVQSPNVEPQDVAPEVRHYATMRAQLTLSQKVPFLFSRGAPQVRDGFRMMQIMRGLSEDEFGQTPCVWTVINTNSPLILDIPMLQGLIDFARAGQPSVITPFTLAGAMAPVTLAGALVQQHAEFLAALVVTQLAKPGAPAVYGAFTSNVDMKSGSPAFGTPENVRAAFASGQLARFLDLPWRSSMPSASNCVDAQSIYESQMALWGATLGGANLVLHAAGWIEGGLTASMEKFIIDIEMLQQMAELMQPVRFDDAELAFEAIREVGSGGHFFGAAHTIDRYRTAFYAPFVSDWSNFGQWTEAGAKTATERANTIWKQVLRDFQPPATDPPRIEELDAFIAKRTEEGGAPPES